MGQTGMGVLLALLGGNADSVAAAYDRDTAASGLTPKLPGPARDGYQIERRPFTRGPVERRVMLDWMLNKWDWTIYRLAYHSIRRMCERNPGFSYLFELWIREWRSKHPISKELESATEVFFESLRDHSA